MWQSILLFETQGCFWSYSWWNCSKIPPYIYIYIYREREREPKKHNVRCAVEQCLKQQSQSLARQLLKHGNDRTHVRTRQHWSSLSYKAIEDSPTHQLIYVHPIEPMPKRTCSHLFIQNISLCLRVCKLLQHAKTFILRLGFERDLRFQDETRHCARALPYIW